MRDPPPIFRRGEILLAGELLTGGDVPQAEFSLQATVALAGHAAGDERLRVDGFPILELRRGVDIDDFFDEGGLIDRCEQPAALEVVGDDLGDADSDLAIRRRSRHEIRDRDRDGLRTARCNLESWLPLCDELRRPHHLRERQRSTCDGESPSRHWCRQTTRRISAERMNHVRKPCYETGRATFSIRHTSPAATSYMADKR